MISGLMDVLCVFSMIILAFWYLTGFADHVLSKPIGGFRNSDIAPVQESENCQSSFENGSHVLLIQGPIQVIRKRFAIVKGIGCLIVAGVVVLRFSGTLNRSTSDVILVPLWAVAAGLFFIQVKMETAIIKKE